MRLEYLYISGSAFVVTHHRRITTPGTSALIEPRLCVREKNVWVAVRSVSVAVRLWFCVCCAHEFVRALRFVPRTKITRGSSVDCPLCSLEKWPKFDCLGLRQATQTILSSPWSVQVDSLGCLQTLKDLDDCLGAERGILDRRVGLMCRKGMWCE